MYYCISMTDKNIKNVSEKDRYSDNNFLNKFVNKYKIKIAEQAIEIRVLKDKLAWANTLLQNKKVISSEATFDNEYEKYRAHLEKQRQINSITFPPSLVHEYWIKSQYEKAKKKA